MDGLFREFSEVAKRAFEEEGFEPETVLQLMNKFKEEAERSWTAMDAAQEEQVRSTEATLDAAESYLDSLLDSGMAQFDSIADFAADGQMELDKLTNFAKATQKMTEKLSAAASIASKQYFEAALVSATAAFALKSAEKAMRAKLFRASW